MKNLVSKFPQYFSSHTRVIPLLGVLTLLLALPLTLNLIKNNQDNRQQAASLNDQLSIQQNNPNPGVQSLTCESVNGRCVTESEWASTQAIFAAASVDGTYACPQKGGQNQVCIVQERANVSNQTCDVSAGFTCDYRGHDECEATLGVGNCEHEANARCHNGNLCMKISSSSNSNFPPLGSPCPDGSSNFSCGYGSPNTQCPVCSPTSSCSTGNYTIQACSGAGSCTNDPDCAGNPPSCPAGQTGQVVCQKAAGQTQGACVTVNCR